ncbi:uncharacterized protein LOC122251789 isoform X2 [Penaeus japonicus]|uniref:uncharacterized protein LOC122251789 isoform X2 n=1 Tax=Penaeus japonicus TaxID=27405 RepID=UPI001C711CD3|nr:uncharacterized protein LOC122251789 isoform X2 [Penaeus japonicus]
MSQRKGDQRAKGATHSGRWERDEQVGGRGCERSSGRRSQEDSGAEGGGEGDGGAADASRGATPGRGEEPEKNTTHERGRGSRRKKGIESNVKKSGRED